MRPTIGRRKWIKVWTEEWLEGTTRYQMTDAQRAFWMDLLAMAGRSRIDGIVCSGQDGDTIVGYPLSKFEGLLSEKIDVLATFALFEKTGKIRVEVSENPSTRYVIFILNWDRYQSDYAAQNARQRKFRRKKAEQCHTNVTPDVTPLSQNVTRVEVRSEKKEVEKEGEERRGDSPTSRLTSFSDADRVRLWEGIAAVSADLVAPEKYTGQRARIEEAAEKYGLDAVLEDARRFLKGRVTAPRDRKYAAKQWSEVVEQGAYAIAQRRKREAA